MTASPMGCDDPWPHPAHKACVGRDTDGWPLQATVGQGILVHVSGDRLRRASEAFDEKLRVAALGGDHVWVTLVTHLIADPATFHAGGAHLDAESIVSANLGCYVCEQPWDPRLTLRRCPGEPSR